MTLRRRMRRALLAAAGICHDCPELADEGCTRCRTHRIADAARARRRRARALGRPEKPRR